MNAWAEAFLLDDKTKLRSNAPVVKVAGVIS